MNARAQESILHSGDAALSQYLYNGYAGVVALDDTRNEDRFEFNVVQLFSDLTDLLFFSNSPMLVI